VKAGFTALLLLALGCSEDPSPNPYGYSQWALELADGKWHKAGETWDVTGCKRVKWERYEIVSPEEGGLIVTEMIQLPCGAKP
jgi:hypothetical protein